MICKMYGEVRGSIVLQNTILNYTKITIRCIVYTVYCIVYTVAAHNMLVTKFFSRAILVYFPL